MTAWCLLKATAIVLAGLAAIALPVYLWVLFCRWIERWLTKRYGWERALDIAFIVGFSPILLFALSPLIIGIARSLCEAH